MRSLVRTVAALFAGCLFTTATRAADEPVVALPPMLIEEASTPIPWLYARVDGNEYLSRCSNGTTRAYAEMHRDRMQLVHGLFPPELFMRMDVPRVTLLVSQRVKQTATAEVLNEVLEAKGSSGRSRGGYSEARTAPNMLLQDADIIGVFAYIDENNFKREEMTVSSDYVRLLLERRTPVLPRWLIEGIVGIYNDIQFTERPLALRTMRWSMEAARLVKDSTAPRTLLSAREIFIENTLEDKARATLARQQINLVLRWALDSRNGVREQFWKFAARAGEVANVEAEFEACFGFGFSDARDRWSDYLPLALKAPLQLDLPKQPISALELRPATPSEVARLRGEWERLSVPLVRTRYPDHVTRYLAQARRTLQRAREPGESDPRLWAAAALCEVDAGESGPARELLTRAAGAKVVRPRAYYELARLEWTELVRAQPPSKEFTLGELVPVMEPLRVGLTQSPTMPEAAGLWADAWVRCRTAPTPQETAQLVELGRQFVAQPRVCFRIARALGRHGKAEEARALLSTGSLYVQDEAMRANFGQLFRAIAK